MTSRKYKRMDDKRRSNEKILRGGKTGKYAAEALCRTLPALILAVCVGGCGAQEVPAAQESNAEEAAAPQESDAEETSAPQEDGKKETAAVQESDAGETATAQESGAEEAAASQENVQSEADFDADTALYGCSPVSADLSRLPAMENRVYAGWKGKIYYRQYSDEDLEDGALWGAFAGTPDTAKELMCMEPDGSVTQVGLDYGHGAFSIVNGRIYSQKYKQARKDGRQIIYAVVYSSAIDGSDVKEYDACTLLDVRGDRIVCATDGNGIAWIDGRDGQYHILVSGTDMLEGVGYPQEYLDATEEEVFFSQITENGSETYAPYDLTLYSVDYQGNMKELATVTEQEYVDCLTGELMQYPLYIPCFQIWEDELYFSVGSANGNAYMYSGGMIYRVKKDGSGFTRLADGSPSARFYLYAEGADSALFCRLFEEEAGRAADGMWPIVLQGKFADDIVLRDAEQTYYDRPHGYVTEGGADAVLFYPDTSGICYVLLTPEESEELGIRTHVDGHIVQQITDIEYLNGRLFFTVTDLTYSEEYSIGWRDGYERGRSVCYCKDMVSGKIEALYEY